MNFKGFITLVQLNIDVEGFHSWEDAPTDLGYLRYPHRHIFKIRMWYKVGHLDRQIEINQKQNFYEKYLKEKYGDEVGRCQFGGMSCEMIAKELLDTNDDMFAVQVLEDGFGGAVVVRE